MENFQIEKSNRRALRLREDECQTSGTRVLRNKTNPVCVRGSFGPTKSRVAAQTMVENPPESRLKQVSFPLKVSLMGTWDENITSD